MKRRLAWVVMIPCVLGLASLAAAQEAQEVRARLPDGAALAVFYNGDRPEMGKTALSEIWNEPGVKEFCEPIWEAIRAALRQQSTEKPDWPDFVALELALKTQIAFALYPKASGSEPDWLVVADAGPEGSPVRAGIQKALEKVKGEAVQIGGAAATKTDKNFTYCFVDQAFFMGAPAVLERTLDAKVQRLTASPLYRELAGQADLGKEVVGCFLDYANLPQLFSADLNQMQRSMRIAGLDRMKGAALTWAPKGRGMMTTLYVSTPTDSGIVAALVAKPVDPAILKMVPKNAHAMFAFNLDAGKVYDGILAAIGAADPQALEKAKSAVAEFETQTGVKVREEFLAALDQGTAVVVQEGGMFMPNITLLQKVNDAAQADEALGKLLTAGGALAGQALSGMFPHGAMPPAQPAGLRSVTYGGAIINYVDLAIVSPSYVLKDGYLIVTASPVEMKDFLDGMGKGSILENEDWASVRAQLPLAAPQYLYYGDYKSAMKKVYYLLPTVAAAVNSIAAVPVKVDPGKLPGAERFASHLFGAAAACQFSPGAFKACIFSPTGTEAPMSYGIMPAMVLPSFLMGIMMEARSPQVMELPMAPLPVEPPNPL